MVQPTITHWLCPEYCQHKGLGWLQINSDQQQPAQHGLMRIYA